MARKRGNSWQADAFHNGRRVRRSFGSKSDAELWEAQVRSADEKGLPVPRSNTPTGGTSGDITLRETFKAYGHTIWADAKCPEVPARNVDVLCRYIGEETPIRDIDEELLDDVIRKELADGKKNASINRHFSTLKKLLRYAKRKGHIAVVPEMTSLREGTGRLRFLSEDEFERIEATYQAHGALWDLRYIHVLLYSGTRFSEPLLSERTAISPNQLYLKAEITKGRRERYVPVENPKGQKAIKQFLAATNDKYPFQAKIEYGRFRYRWQQLIPKAGILDNPTPHVLRHTAASWMIQRGVDIYRVKEFLGHADIGSTQIYAHLNQSALEEAAAVL